MRFQILPLTLTLLASATTTLACYQTSRCSAPNGPDIAVQSNGHNDPEHNQAQFTVAFKDGKYGPDTFAGMVNHLRCDVVVKIKSPAANDALQCWIVPPGEQWKEKVSRE
ncbi:hypothetical protein J4E90_010588 [Alternaria incomplexa]|uniref:uncharacterized protein n=1 Tax=Alternaria incomplexa TaxID=1187928 RepID=UPI00221F3A90|nr:uncharacterized protein J4E90_010588 [Alternaria incomplexa]KAI4906369.1 hypothetical protein J4E90_010588 [Alternaria incomplexa]